MRSVFHRPGYGPEPFQAGDDPPVYHDWYRPDLQAVYRGGDIDVDQMERTIKEKFSDLKNPAAKGYGPGIGYPDR